MASTTIRTSVATRDRLGELAAERGVSITDLVASLTQDELDRRLLAEHERAMADLAPDDRERLDAELAEWHAAPLERGPLPEGT